MPTADEILGRVTSPEYTIVRTARVLIAPQDLIAEHERLNAQFARLSRSDHGGIDDSPHQVARELVELEDRLEAFMVPFKFRQLTRKAYSDLLAAHAPTAQQRKADRTLEFNPETFPAALISACLLDPVMTVDQVRVLEVGVPELDADGAPVLDETGAPVMTGGLSDGQFNVLFNTAVTVNVSGLAAPKSVAAGVLRRMNDASVPPPITTESLDPSS